MSSDLLNHCAKPLHALASQIIGIAVMQVSQAGARKLIAGADRIFERSKMIGEQHLDDVLKHLRFNHARVAVPFKALNGFTKRGDFVIHECSRAGVEAGTMTEAAGASSSSRGGRAV